MDHGTEEVVWQWRYRMDHGTAYTVIVLCSPIMKASLSQRLRVQQYCPSVQ